jgi:uncharacterized membrane protein YdjX (TVP38/TMEM64 family)
MKKMLLPFLLIMTGIIIIFLIFGSFEKNIFLLLEGLKTKPVEYSVYSLVILSADIVLPVPSSIVMYLNGFVLGIYGGAVLSFASLMVSSVAGYFIGKLTLGFQKKEPEKQASHLLHTFGALAIIITRGIPVISETICIVCGYNKMPFRKYVLNIIIGTVPLCILYAYFGYIGKDKNDFLPAFVCSILVSALFWILGKKLFARIQKV